MQERVAVYFRGGRLKDFDLQTFGKSQHVDGAEDTCFCGLNGVPLIMDWRGWTREVVDLADFHIEGKRHIMPEKLEIGVG